MAPDAAAARLRAAGMRRRERAFYLGMAILCAGILFGGFARTFFLRPMFVDRPLAPLILGHGIVFTAWFAVLLAQATLVAAGRTDLHRRLGIAGVALAAGMVVLGTFVAIRAAQRGFSPGGQPPLEFLIVPLTDVVLFGGLVAAAFRYRRKSETHKRLMLLATIAIFPPATARLLRGHGLFALFGLPDLILVACIVYDTVAHRRLHRAFLWGGLAIVASQVLRIALADTDAWLAIARWLVG